MTHIRFVTVMLLGASLSTWQLFAGEPLTKSPLQNPTFSAGVQANGLPIGWSRYGGTGANQAIKILPKKRCDGTGRTDR